MIEESKEQLPQQSAPTATTSGDMAEALEAMKTSSPSMRAAIDALGVKPDELADAHQRATAEEHDAVQPVPDKGKPQD